MQSISQNDIFDKITLPQDLSGNMELNEQTDNMDPLKAFPDLSFLSSLPYDKSIFTSIDCPMICSNNIPNNEKQENNRTIQKNDDTSNSIKSVNEFIINDCQEKSQLIKIFKDENIEENEIKNVLQNDEFFLDEGNKATEILDFVPLSSYFNSVIAKLNEVNENTNLKKNIRKKPKSSRLKNFLKSMNYKIAKSSFEEMELKELETYFMDHRISYETIINNKEIQFLNFCYHNYSIIAIIESNKIYFDFQNFQFTPILVEKYNKSLISADVFIKIKKLDPVNKMAIVTLNYLDNNHLNKIKDDNDPFKDYFKYKLENQSFLFEVIRR